LYLGFAATWSPPKRAAVMKTLGVILIVFGLIGLVWGGFTYTTREKVVDIGPIHASRDKTHNILLPPIAGALVLIGGIALVVLGRK
jgi:TRAP-type C4-dicarboxylate transport system permease small subunit